MGTCVFQSVISSDICDWYEWEFKLNEWETNWAFEFGYVATPITETIVNWNDAIGNNMKWDHYTINICVFDHFRLFGKNTEDQPVMKHDGNKFKITLTKGDRFRIRIDFKDKDIKIYYNDQFVNSMYKNEIADSVVAAVSISGSITVTNTDYQ